MSMAQSIVDGTLDINLVIFYGCNKREDIIYHDKLNSLQEESNGKLKVIYVLPPRADGFEKGFITAPLIKKYVDVNNSFSSSASQAMYDFS